MRSMNKLLWVLGAFLVAALALGVTVKADAQSSEPQIPDHGEISEYTGPETCMECHLSAGKQVAESLHYQNQGPAPFLVGAEEDKFYGMANTY